MRTTRVWAHRGNSRFYPENTLASFESALQLGVDGLEFDVHLSKDGEVVVIHDDTLQRTTNGHGYVIAHTLAELQALDAGSWFHSDFAGARIPTLVDVLKLLQAFPNAAEVQINIELKSGVVEYPGLEEKVWNAIQAYGVASRTVISSFNHFSLRNLKQSHPEARIGVLYMEGMVDPWRYASFLQADAIHPLFIAFDEQVVRDTHEKGISVHAFTVNDEATMRRLVDWNVDAVITDVPELLLTLAK